MVDFTKDHCDELHNVLSNDLRMLREIEVMDYSLLLIIIHFPKPTDPDYDTIISLMADNRYFSRIFKSKNMKYIYILGIIDYLQKFNVAKFFENKYKSILYGNEIKYVSAVDPMIYSDRMLNFAKDYIFISSA
jgi:hypothetical protein